MTERTEPRLTLSAGEQETAGAADEAATMRRFKKTEPRPVVITGIRISFLSIVWLMLKWAIASVPAAIILIAVFTFVPELFRGLRLG
ncbi:hypothetical protein [Stutzerimonas xanthomarina]|uniref:Uncharacterized protein n=2 Tax=Stutzerimonas xanthomarina TaxID=271420 RepID=A0A1M5NXR6_9GAMM|nr:hypothetical protein [Stutzerimonas xanthomarina]MCP9338696.1 hypothetical protein [Stutzerimonas xanthomarina]SEH79757.1 hypothetical protein SAMN05216535_1950 [Stutzerimonas xanthomarina]SHG94255.1 hypothetical protein SAMN02744645_1860 [Stutzerimonas xanthomarina DSM 18231]